MASRLVKEEIDTRILNLLGIDDVFDIDYTTYLLLLREAMVKGSFGKSKLSDEELALLSNERKRIKNKQDNGRFEIKSKKISASKFTSGKFLPKSRVGGSIVKFQKPTGKGPLSFIGDILGSIFKTISEKNKLDKKNAEQQKKEEENEKRRKRESLLEKTGKGIREVKNLVQKAVAPFQSIIDKIINFLVFTFLGKAFNDFLNWVSDPENKKKLDSVVRFLVNHWPLIVGGFVLFGTSFGRFIRGTLKLVARSIFFLGRQIPKLRNFITKHRKTSFLIASAAPLLSREAANILTQKPNDADGLKPSSMDLGEGDMQDAKKSTDEISKLNIPKFVSGGLISPNINLKLPQAPPNIKDIQMAGGGAVDKQTGMNITGAGPDTQLVAVQPGEIVMSKKAVDAYGPQFFLGLNKAAGATNVPKYTNNIQLAANGGMVGSPGPSIFAGTPSFGDLPLIKAANSAGIKGLELASFLSQMSHETGGYKWSHELGKGRGMGYSGGSQYYGRGYIQLTHDYNYKKYGDKLGLDLVTNPDLASQPDVAAKIAVEYWKNNVRPSVGNKWDDVFLVSRAINNPSASSNLGIRGWKDRVSKFNEYRNKLNSGLLEIKKPKSDVVKKPKSEPNFLQTVFGMMGTSLPFAGGGLVQENTGMNILGATADRQLAALQPGEYVLPAGTVSKLGVSLIEKIVSMTDSDSNAAKLGKSRGIKTIPGPPVRGASNMMPITLPPITGGTDPQMTNNASGTSVPQIDAICPTSMEVRESLASIYGIV